jgi:hypothetical protein
MRGGTSKGVFFLAQDLPTDPAARDRTLLRVIGSPDPYGQHIDGLGGATSSTSKVVIVSRSQRPGSDVDYLFGAVAVREPVIDWSGNCGNLSAAVGPFAIGAGLVHAPPEGIATVRIWQANIGKPIIARVPMRGGEVVEDGDFVLDGVAFPGAEIVLEFVNPADDDGGAPGSGMFPTGNRIDRLEIPGFGHVEATLINAGNPTIVIDATAMGLRGTELQSDVNGRSGILDLAETIRAHGAVAMKLVATPALATSGRPHTPKLALVAPPADYVASSGTAVRADSVDVLVRIFSMGKLHHAMTGTGAVAIAAAAAVPGTVLSRITATDSSGMLRFGHPSGSLTVGARAAEARGAWTIEKVVMSRSARRLMEGWVRVPAEPAT